MLVRVSCLVLMVLLSRIDRALLDQACCEAGSPLGKSCFQREPSAAAAEAVTVLWQHLFQLCTQARCDYCGRRAMDPYPLLARAPLQG